MFPSDCHPVVEVVGIGVEGETVLFHVVETGGGPRRLSGPVQRRQQHGRENRNDGDDNEEFDESK